MSDEFPDPAPGLFDDWLAEHKGWPDWFTAGRTTPTSHIQAVARGLHPLGLPLLKQEGATCGNCDHLLRSGYHDKVYLKCNLRVETRGPGTDVRKKWAACTDWEEETGDDAQNKPDD